MHLSKRFLFRHKSTDRLIYMSTAKLSQNYVITCGDEGVQINHGIRLAFAGSGFRLKGFSQAVKATKKLFEVELNIVSQEENGWIKEQLELSDWRQVNVMSQQHTEALAGKEDLVYVGHLAFTDPKQLKNLSPEERKKRIDKHFKSPH